MSESQTGRRLIDLVGSSGSIGENTLKIVAEYPSRLRVASLAAGGNWERLAEQARAFGPEIIALADERYGDRLKAELSGFKGRILIGPESPTQAVAESDGDTAVIASVGFAGVTPTLAAIERGQRICLANKETLVAAGAVVAPRAQAAGIEIAPIDSEHSAIWQCLRAGTTREIRRIWLTASGGPFRQRDPATFAQITVAEALAHPTWDMGAKITIDSATMMNKAFEIIEAVWLFEVDPEQVEVVIHPQSTIHSLVEFVDGSTIAQLGSPDMKVPIRMALFAPERVATADPESVAFSPMTVGSLEFEAPDPVTFPALRLAREVIATGGTAGAVFNGADEAAVAAFLDETIPFDRIPVLIEEALGQHDVVSEPTLDDIISADRWAKNWVRGRIGAAATRQID